MYLHEAIDAVLQQDDGRTCREIALTIDRQNLYRQSDGESPPSNQVSARVSHHPEMFERRDGRVFRYRNAQN